MKYGGNDDETIITEYLDANLENGIIQKILFMTVSHFCQGRFQ